MGHKSIKWMVSWNSMVALYMSYLVCPLHRRHPNLCPIKHLPWTLQYAHRNTYRQNKKIAANLLDAVYKLQNKNRKCTGRHATTLDNLSIIFKGQSDTLPDDAANMPNQTPTSTTRTEAIKKPKIPLQKNKSINLNTNLWGWRNSNPWGCRTANLWGWILGTNGTKNQKKKKAKKSDQRTYEEINTTHE